MLFFVSLKSTSYTTGDHHQCTICRSIKRAKIKNMDGVSLSWPSISRFVTRDGLSLYPSQYCCRELQEEAREGFEWPSVP